MKIAAILAASLALVACGSTGTALKKAPDLDGVDIPKGFAGTINIQYNIAMDNSAISASVGGTQEDACSDSGENLIGDPGSTNAGDKDKVCDNEAAKAVDGDNRVNTEIDEAVNAYRGGLLQ